MSTITSSTESTEKQRVHVCSLKQLQQQQVKVVHGDGRPIAVYAHGDETEQVSAVDNRCPHMGFPLHKGTVQNGILTCHWHHARFDVCSGCAFDVWADDIPAYDTQVEDGEVYVIAASRMDRDKDHYMSRLLVGMEQNIGLIQAKSLAGLLSLKVDVSEIVKQVALFGGKNHEEWRDGMTSLTLVANLRPYLSDQTAFFALSRGIRMVANNCAGATPRRPRHSLTGADHDIDTLIGWAAQWSLARHRDGFERSLLTAIEGDSTIAELTDMVSGTISDRVFAGTGHIFDFSNKAFELLEHVGSEHADAALPLLVPGITSARGAEEQANWHHPVELIGPLRELEAKLPSIVNPTGNWQDDGKFVDSLLADDASQILAAIEQAFTDGASITDVSQRVAYAAGMRLARFASSNDVRDWFDPQHTFNFANAADQAVRRSDSPRVWRAVLHAALAVYQDRFLNVPPAKLPGEKNSLDHLPTDGDELLSELLASFDQRAEPERAAQLAARYLALSHDEDKLIDTLTFATVREDLDFHTLQVLEAGVRQVKQWGNSAEAKHIMIGVVRSLAAHCPTQRANLQTAQIALRLHRGDRIYEDDEE